MDSPELWSPMAREAYASAAQRARLALDRHAAAIEAVRDVAALETTATELETALAAMSEAEQTLTGAAAYWLDLDDSEDAAAISTPHISDPDAPDPDALADGSVPVTADLQLTMDVTDAGQLLSLARELDPSTPISSIEDAIFVVTGQLGWDQLLADQVAGVTMQGASAQLATP